MEKQSWHELCFYIMCCIEKQHRIRRNAMNADLIIISNVIYDGIKPLPFSGYVAIKENRIIHVGRNKDYADYLQKNTKVLLYEDQLVMTGFHDSHTHIIMAGMYKIYANLMAAKSEEEAVQMLKAHQDTLSVEEPWVYGFGWYHVFWDNKKLPSRHSLDKAFPDRPVMLINAEAHGAWVNTKALELAGIDKQTLNPFGGEIERDENGDATGFLYEAATGLVGKVAFDFTPEQEMRIIRVYMKAANKYGITSTNDMMPYFHGNMGTAATYHLLEEEGSMTVRTHLAPDLIGDMDQSEHWRKTYTSDKLKINLLKQFLDGVCTTHTALMLEPYADAPDSTGYSLTDVDAIQKAVPEAHRRGFSVRLHSCGDRSARMALDFYEEAINLYGKNQCRHAIEHCELVSDEDIPRFGKLGVIPSVQPEHIAITQTFAENPYPVVLGEVRAAQTWPFRKLLDSAGILAIGSDCPVVDNNPFLEIFRAVTRVHNDGKPEGGWNPTQILTIEEALKFYTYGSAYLVSREHEMGTLEDGKFADVVVLDRNLFKVDPWDILKTQVLLTIMDGNIVYEKEKE
jgi:predicted amidohydrolase YtcJ